MSFLCAFLCVASCRWKSSAQQECQCTVTCWVMQFACAWHFSAVRLATACFFLRYCCDTHHRRPKTFLWSPVMPRVAPPGEMKTSPACFPGPNVLPIPTATAPPNLPQPCCSAAQCNTLPPHAPSNPASNRPNPGRNPWIEVALGQIGPRGSRTTSAGFQAPSARMSHLRHLTPLYSSTQSVNTGGAMAAN